MVGWHHRLNGHEFEQILRDTEGQRSLACCSPLRCRVRHNGVTEQQQQRLTQLMVIKSGFNSWPLAPVTQR